MTTNQITINRDAVRSENLEQKNLTKQELNKTYYQFNQEKLKVKRRQRYLLNKNKSLTEQCSENKTEQSSKSEQTEQSPKIVQSKISEQNKKVEPEEVDDQVSRSEQFSPTEQKRTEQFPFFSEPSLTEQIVQTRTPTEHQDQTEQKKLNTEHPEQNFVQLEPKAEIYPPPEGISQLSEKIKAVVDTEEILQPDNTVVKSTEPESVVDQVVKKVEPEPAVVKIVKSSGLETPETILQLEAKILQLKEESAQEKAEKEKWKSDYYELDLTNQELQQKLRNTYSLKFTEKAQQYLGDLVKKHIVLTHKQPLASQQESQERDFLDDWTFKWFFWEGGEEIFSNHD